ncbi:MAG: sugar phosphate isomerase/epimerase [Tannerellaceae bacterium]|jgi:sugar phosphate isomerase/epimerase|nr:sugar phosphate isomerase/epimerase [Tannerellaceae bacterium]
MNNVKNFIQTRRAFLGTSAALAGITILPSGISSCKPAATPAATDGKPTSNFGGVQIGAITYSWRDMPAGLENIISYCIESGINSIELMSGDLEDYLGAPKNPMQDAIRQWMQQQRAAAPPPPAPAGNAPQGPPAGQQRPRMQLPPELQAGIDKYNEDIKGWRLSVDMNRVASAKQLLDDAGIEAHIVKFSPGNWEDDLIDYAFKVAKAMGARGVTEEIGEEAVKKMAPVAERNGMYAIFHNHMQFADVPSFSYDPFIAVSEAVRFNFDAGHFFGSTGIHPNEMIKTYHDKIFSIHIKDKTGPTAEKPNTNQVWGQGEMPLADVLLLLKQEKWPIYCDIELEYPVNPWSTSVKEVRTCVQYARNILI